MVQPLSSSSAMAICVLTCTISGVRPAEGVQAAQPAKQFGVLHRRYGPGQALKHVVVGVDQSGCDQMPAGIDHRVGGQGVRRQVSGRADKGDAVVADEDRGIWQFPGAGRVRMVQRGDTAGVVNQQVWHQDAFHHGGNPVTATFGNTFAANPDMVWH